MKNSIAAIILAAGKGERMKSDKPKVLHEVACRPMLGYVLDLVKQLRIKRYVVVVGYQYQQVKAFLPASASVAIQRNILGTADAVKQALPLLSGFRGTVIVLYGDNPLLKPDTVKKLIAHHTETKAAATLLTAQMDKPDGYGRILRDSYDVICGIVEDKDADEYQKTIKEINTGILCFEREKLARYIKRIKPNNAKKEYYLTDIIEMLYKDEYVVESIKADDPKEVMGVNSRVELAYANKIMQQRIQENLMKNGVTIVDPDSTFISWDAKIGTDTVIYPFTVIEKDVKIGSHCSVGPFARLRPGTRLDDFVTVGNFIEISRTKIASGSRAKHFGFLGDARLGHSVNIGAGTVTANYDGKHKNTTIIKDKAFIGSDTVLVAPVVVGKQARTGAGSVVTRNKNVDDFTTVVGVPAKPIKTKMR
ncbi:MAG: NTP transferase domain-containing protein [Candidatus Omnitrophica bacterium]|nr:NTP transferase domain-containing protein [Candidatus Omnitrophota bacterium]